MKEPNFIPDRLNEQPPVMRGCSWPELHSIIRNSFAIAFPIALSLAVWWDNYSTMLGSIPVFAGISFWLLTGQLAKKKNGRPVGYFTILANLKKQRRGFGKFYIEYDGYWKITKD
ncbi:DUF3487 family protein [Aliikangiella maris]|uniref:DUF3487 family protein n=2 Tax=Aliikangiella maris TaxID=3162458 RepID=A0ABV3MTS1_9GAMM